MYGVNYIPTDNISLIHPDIDTCAF